MKRISYFIVLLSLIFAAGFRDTLYPEKDGNFRIIFTNSTINNNSRISNPWYILVDENGNVIREHAERPSEIVANGLSFQ